MSVPGTRLGRTVVQGHADMEGYTVGHPVLVQAHAVGVQGGRRSGVGLIGWANAEERHNARDLSEYIGEVLSPHGRSG